MKVKISNYVSFIKVEKTGFIRNYILNYSLNISSNIGVNNMDDGKYFFSLSLRF